MMAEPDPSPLTELLDDFKRSDRIYETCSTFYKRSEDILADDHIDKLTLAILQQYKLGNHQQPINIQIHEKGRQLKKTQETLRLGVIGDIAAGKSSMINYLMGAEFLPTDQGVCTKVVCEIYNSNFRHVEIIYCDDSRQERVMEKDPEGRQWYLLRDIIENGYTNCELTEQRVKVARIKIFWPLDIFQDTRVLKMNEAYEDIDGSPGNSLTCPTQFKSPSVCFVDFPGLDYTADKDGAICGMIPILEAIDSNAIDGILFVVDNSLSNGIGDSTIKAFMYQVITTFPEFDTETCLFICNKWDLVSKREQRRTELKQTILEKLHEPWPTVQQKQIITFSCKEKPDEHVLITQMYNFIKTVRGRKLEDFWSWLTNLCEVANGLMLNRREWCKTREILDEIKQKAIEDVRFLKSVKNEVKYAGSKILGEKVEIYKTVYKEFLTGKLYRYCSMKQLNEHEEAFNEDLLHARRDFSMNFKHFKEDIDLWFQTLQNNIIKSSWLLHLFHKTSRKSSFKYDFLLYGIVIAVPVAKFVLVGSFLKGEIKDMQLNNPNNRIDQEVNQLSLGVRELQQNFIDRLDRQMALLNNIDDLQLQASPTQTVSRLQNVINRLLTLFVTDVASHEIQPESVEVIDRIDTSGHLVDGVRYQGEEMARKRIYTKINLKNKEISESRTSHSLSYQVSHCKELILLRKLNQLDKDQDYHHFVQFKGSCIKNEVQNLTLYIFMERCDGNLEGLSHNQGLNDMDKIDVCLGAAKGVAFLHRYGIVHRDIKPQNFLVKGGIVKICDVGHSKEEDLVVTLGQSRGTKKYHPPEITNDNSLHTKMSDIYSLGLVFCEVWGEVDVSSAKQLKTHLNVKIPSVLKKIILDCLADDPSKRPDIESVVGQLSKIKENSV